MIGGILSRLNNINLHHNHLLQRYLKTRQSKHFDKTGKWRGRLEYLRRGDPFDQKKKEEAETKIKDQIGLEKNNLSRRERVYLWGNAECGALGQRGFIEPGGNRNKVNKMRRPFISTLGHHYNIKSVACGNGFTLFVTDDKEKYLFGTGLNQLGQLGYHKRLDEAGRQTGQPLEMLILPASITLPLERKETLRRVAAGRTHSLALTSEGRVLSWGNNAYGQCGRPVIEDEDYFVNQVVHELEVGLIKAVVAGQDHSLMVSVTGEVFSCGWGADGQTGLGHYNNCGQPTRLRGDIQGEKVVKVAGAADCVLALSESGEVFGWGNRLSRF